MSTELQPEAIDHSDDVALADQLKDGHDKIVSMNCWRMDLARLVDAALPLGEVVTPAV